MSDRSIGAMSLDRRRFLRGGAHLAGLVALGGLAAACRSTITDTGTAASSSDPAVPASEPATSFVWATPESYAQPGMLQPFTTEHGIDVETELFSDVLELFPKLTTGGTQITGLVDGSYHSELTYEAGLLQPLDLANIPNYDNVIPAFQAAQGAVFDGQVYGVPIAWGTDSIAYREDRTGGVIDSIDALWDERFAGKISMPAGIHESIFVSAIHLGFENPFSLDEDQLKAVEEDLVRQKPLVRAYWKQIGELKDLFATDEIALAWAWTDVLALARRGVPIRWADLEQGQLGWYDANYVLAEASAEEKLAMEMLIDYTLGDSYGVILGEEVAYATPSLAAIERMPEELADGLNLTDPEGFLANAVWWTVEREPKAYEETWQAVLNA